MDERKRGLSGTALKWIAMVTMTIDHTAEVLIPYSLEPSPYLFMRLIGRLAFPIYVFLLVEGFHHTGNRRKYACRLGLFALISEIPFNLAVGGSFLDPKHQNVFLTLFLGFLMLWGLDLLRERWLVPEPESGEIYGRKLAGGDLSRLLTILILVVAFMMIAGALNTDYSESGIVMIALVGLLYPFRWKRSFLLAGAAAVVWYGFWVQNVAALAYLFPISLYNGEKGRTGKILQWVFYLYYPVHLMILVTIKAVLM